MKIFRNVSIGTLLVVVMSACNINAPQPLITPTAELLVSETPTPLPTLTTTSTNMPAPTDTIAPVIVQSDTPLPPVQPTMPPAPTETPGPYVHVIQPNDTLGYILQLQPWGYPPFDQAVIAEVVRLNNLRSADVLPPPGSELLIPRRTPTPIPVGIELTQTSDANLGLGERVGNSTLPQGANAGCHSVRAGETIVGIADEYNTTLEILSQLNQNLNWFGCRFDQYSGGPNCSPIIREGQCINVPLPTPTPIPTATFTGRETATPTPTFAPSRLVFPPDGAIVPAIAFTLQWASVGVLPERQVYLIELQDLTNNSQWLNVTRQTSLTLPETLIPSDGQTHRMQWRVSVAQADAQGVYNYVGGVGTWRTFQWQSR